MRYHASRAVVGPKLLFRALMISSETFRARGVKLDLTIRFLPSAVYSAIGNNIHRKKTGIRIRKEE
jgi:hypothetical protein